MNLKLEEYISNSGVNEAEIEANVHLEAAVTMLKHEVSAEYQAHRMLQTTVLETANRSND